MSGATADSATASSKCFLAERICLRAASRKVRDSGLRQLGLQLVSQRQGLLLARVEFGCIVREIGPGLRCGLTADHRPGCGDHLLLQIDELISVGGRFAR